MRFDELVNESPAGELEKIKNQIRQDYKKNGEEVNLISVKDIDVARVIMLAVNEGVKARFLKKLTQNLSERYKNGENEFLLKAYVNSWLDRAPDFMFRNPTERTRSTKSLFNEMKA